MAIVMMMMMMIWARGWGENDESKIEEEHNHKKEDDWSQDRETHFMRACAIEIYKDISQEPFYMKINRENSEF